MLCEKKSDSAISTTFIFINLQFNEYELFYEMGFFVGGGFNEYFVRETNWPDY